MPRTARLLLAAVALAAPLAAPPGASAASSYCSPSGDFCTSTTVQRGAVVIALSTFSFSGNVRVCVSAPGGDRRDCRTFRLRRTRAGMMAFRARWSSNFPDRGSGTYRVRFSLPDGTRLGPLLSFRRR